MSSGLLTEIKNNPWAIALVVVFHLVLIVLLSINLSSDEKPPMPAAKKHEIINAVVVDAKMYDEREKQKKLATQKEIEDKKAAERKRELEKKKALEAKRQAEKKKQQDKLAMEKKKAVEKKKAAEKEKAIALAKKKEAEQKEKERIAREKKEKERLAKEKVAREKKERELKEKQRLEAEKKRKEEEERQRRAEEKAEFERALLEEERREEEARVQAARAARLQTQLQQYVLQIEQQVERNWLRPVSTSEEQSCEVIVTQSISGEVIDVQLQSCTSDNAFQRSVKSAVYKASPLPLPPDPELFDRKIQFTFKPH
jgi:colicin import membrane protein